MLSLIPEDHPDENYTIVFSNGTVITIDFVLVKRVDKSIRGFNVVDDPRTGRINFTV